MFSRRTKTLISNVLTPNTDELINKSAIKMMKKCSERNICKSLQIALKLTPIINQQEIEICNLKFS